MYNKCMIKLKDLDKEILTLKGKPIVDFAGKENLTRKSALISIAELHKPTKPGSGEALRAFNIGVKLVNAKDFIEVEEKDLEFIKELLDKSNVFLSVIIGRLYKYLAEAEASKVDK